ncbi:MAG: 50S ribosomal protein L23 [Gammaproteobacteria bacterium]|nr:50S ribosomal protein L23 [Gammaproteobacteria bacterium]
MNEARLASIIVAPHVSEKASRVAENDRQICLRVRPDADKGEIAQAVERLFEVEVASVTTLNQPGKSRGMGRIRGRRAGWKKAYVTLKPGHDIDFAGPE